MQNYLLWWNEWQNDLLLPSLGKRFQRRSDLRRTRSHFASGVTSLIQANRVQIGNIYHWLWRSTDGVKCLHRINTSSTCTADLLRNQLFCSRLSGATCKEFLKHCRELRCIQTLHKISNIPHLNTRNVPLKQSLIQKANSMAFSTDTAGPADNLQNFLLISDFHTSFFQECPADWQHWRWYTMFEYWAMGGVLIIGQ